jgi:Fe-S-cluster containining protein
VAVIRSIIEKIRDTGFACSRCGSCCRQDEPDSNLVMVTPAEVRQICRETGRSRDEVTEPYPMYMTFPGKARCTFNRALKRKADDCTFLSGNSCTIYHLRPWICRTYPFWLSEGELKIFPCPGLGTPIGDIEAKKIAELLIDRQKAEIGEEQIIGERLSHLELPEEGLVLIDSEGISIIPD